MQIDFDGLEGAVDAIGGIKLDFPYPARDTYTGLDITQAGCQLLNGGYALALARSRHYQYEKDGYWQYDGTSDFGRIQRQNAFLEGDDQPGRDQVQPADPQRLHRLGGPGHHHRLHVHRERPGLAGPGVPHLLVAVAGHGDPADLLPVLVGFGDLGDVLYVQQPQAEQVITQFLGGPPEQATTPPPDPDGVPPATTTTTAAQPVDHASAPTPATSADVEHDHPHRDGLRPDALLSRLVTTARLRADGRRPRQGPGPGCSSSGWRT